MFRGIRVDNGKWVYGSYVRATNHWHNKGIHNDWVITSAIQNGGYFNVMGRYPVVSGTVGQWTGLIDKNGVRIFTGDTVKAKDALEFGGDREFVGVVRFKNASFVIESKIVTHYRWLYYDCEVIKPSIEDME